MKRIFLFAMVFIFSSALAYAGLFDDFLKGLGSPSKDPDEKTMASGLREALSVGTKNAVRKVSQTDGYFGNQAIKILMPEKVRKAADVVGKLGFQKQVDDFILSMNRAAEKAAPGAVSIFVDAIGEMTIEDAKKILNGGETAATEFFRQKTGDRLYNEFKPVVSSSMDEVGVTRSYKAMIAKYESIPFVDKQSLDLDRYVTDRALEGLFYMVGQEEKKIRTDPAARVTELLRTVFGK